MRKIPRLIAPPLLALLGITAASAAEPSMVGIWFSAFQPDEPNVMALIEFKADGTFEEEFRKCENGEVVGAYFESGKWSLMDGIERIVVETINGERSHNEDNYKIETLTDSERRVRLEGHDFVFASRRVNNFEFPKCATGT